MKKNEPIPIWNVNKKMIAPARRLDSLAAMIMRPMTFAAWPNVKIFLTLVARAIKGVKSIAAA